MTNASYQPASNIDFDLVIVQDPHGMFGGKTVDHFTPETVRQFLHCRNGLCQQGGFEPEKFVEFAAFGVTQNTYHCHGHEGSPQGKRKGSPCGNSFVVCLDKRAPSAG